MPVVRASFLGILYLISKLKYLKVNSLNLLFFVGFIVLLFSPDSLFSVSFQLSFIAVLGLLLYSDLLNVRHKNAVVRYIGSSFLMSVVAVLFTAPVVLYYFGKFSLTTIIATPVLVLLLFPYLFLSVFNLFSCFSFYPAVYLMDVLGNLFIDINSFFGKWNFVHYGFSPSVFSVIIYIFLVIAVALYKINNFYKISISVALFFVFLNFSKSSSEQWEVYVLKGKRYPDFVVISPYGECFFKGFSRRLKTVMDKKGCRKRFLIGYYDRYESVAQIESDRGAVIINGVKYRLENRNYRFYPAPVK
ncbi:MAG: ComEC/Rec2 family competence protein [Persephonella sp.]|nr:ComEC/Rec2 family competence protein [Persephonella sp.]